MIQIFTTKYFLSAHAIYLGLLGLFLIFLPDNVEKLLQLEANKTVQLLLQLTGGLYFSLAMLNWMIKGTPIGGIYNRPSLIANLSYYLVIIPTLIKFLINQNELSSLLVILAITSIIFGSGFIRLFYKNPTSS